MLTCDTPDAVAPATTAAALAPEPAEVVEAEVVELPKGAKAPLKDGSAPKGYTVKGNADSGIFHRPGQKYYGATVPEACFATAADAKAAGFRPAKV